MVDSRNELSTNEEGKSHGRADPSGSSHSTTFKIPLAATLEEQRALRAQSTERLYADAHLANVKFEVSHRYHVKVNRVHGLLFQNIKAILFG